MAWAGRRNNGPYYTYKIRNTSQKTSGYRHQLIQGLQERAVEASDWRIYGQSSKRYMEAGGRRNAIAFRLWRSRMERREGGRRANGEARFLSCALCFDRQLSSISLEEVDDVLVL